MSDTAYHPLVITRSVHPILPLNGNSKQLPRQQNDELSLISHFLAIAINNVQKTTKASELLWSKSFGKNVRKLRCGRNVENLNLLISLEFSNKMESHIDMFGAFVVLRVVDESNS